MNLDALRFANFSSLGEAITDWGQMLSKLRDLKEDAERDLDGKAQKADWKGENATVTKAFVTKTANEFGDAVSEAESVHNILKDTKAELQHCKTELEKVIDAGLKKNLTVMDNGDGSFTVTMNIHPDRAAEGTDVPDHSAQDTENLTRDVEHWLRKATGIDDSAAEALNLISKQSKHGFSDVPVYADRDAAARAIKDAKDAAELMKKGDDMSPEEFDRLNRLLGSNKNDPLFQEKFATTLGPRKVMDFWADLSDGSDATGLQQARLDQLGDLQKNLGLTLAGATQSDSAAMDRWQNDMVRLGQERFQTRGATAYGFQLMSNLMRVGDYDDKFLKDYGNALIDTEKKMQLPQNYWQGSGGAMGPTKMNFIGEDFGRDPMTGFMTGLSNSPNAATDFFNSDRNAEYLLKDREVFDDTPLDDDDPNQSREAIGKALVAGATGMNPNDPDARPVPHTPEHQQVLDKSLKYISEAGDDFPGEMRDDMAKVLINHGDVVHRTMSAAGGDTPLDATQLMEVSKQVSRDQDAYGMLNEGMNYAMVEDFHSEKENPEDSLDRAGRTVGFLEEARYQAIGDRTGDELEEVGWKKNWAYHGLGGAVNFIPGVGDIAQRGVDLVATGWMTNEQDRINEAATGDYQETYSQRQQHLDRLAEVWYDANKGWADGETGYSRDQGIYSKIDASANDGNDRAEGLAGDQ